MPLYVYAVINADGSEGDTFEVLQDRDEAPLTEHPETGEPVRRILAAPNVTKTWGESNVRSSLSDKNLDRLGFTKYVKSGDGTYEKRAGKGPRMIRGGEE